MKALDPGKIQSDVEEGAERLEKAADKMYDATLRFENAEEAWDRVRLTEYAKLYHANEGKVPGEEVRMGLVLELHGDGEVYQEFVAARAEMTALDKRYRALAAAVSARQSLLRTFA